MRTAGEKVVITCLDENFTRKARLVRIVQPINPEYGLHREIWEVEFDDDKSPKTASYNEFWLKHEDQ
jgi:hypothetical protein